jgi:hypothetical protein
MILAPWPAAKMKGPTRWRSMSARRIAQSAVQVEIEHSEVDVDVAPLNRHP